MKEFGLSVSLCHGLMAEMKVSEAPKEFPKKTDGFCQGQNGDFDLNLIDYNLALPYDERLIQHDGALRLVGELQQQGKLSAPRS